MGHGVLSKRMFVLFVGKDTNCINSGIMYFLIKKKQTNKAKEKKKGITN